jgi:natural product precursor
MKKLSKLKLKSASLMSDREMKFIVGGYGDYYGYESIINELTQPCHCSNIDYGSCVGTCPKKYTTMSLGGFGTVEIEIPQICVQVGSDCKCVDDI